MPWEESKERILAKRWHRIHRERGVQQEEGSSIRAGVQADIRKNGLFSDQGGVPLWGLFFWGELWGGES